MGTYELLLEQAKNLKEGRDFAVVTIVEARQLARTSGKMLVYPDGAVSGTVGGGMWERCAVRDALRCLERGENAVETYDFSGELAQAGIHCMGTLTVFIECCRASRPQLVVVGGGHVGAAVIKAAREIGFFVTLVDTRGELEIGASMGMADRFLPVRRFGDVAELPLPAGAFYVVSTYGHQVDGEALSGVLRQREPAYIGMLGSQKKVRAIFSQLLRQGVAEEALEGVRSPIGLDLGGETPEELAVAIVAEILAVKNGRPGTPLSARRPLREGEK